MRHYVAMVRDECGDERRATPEEYEYKDFDEDNELEWRLFNAWLSELESYIREQMPKEHGAVWLERVSREAYAHDCIDW